MPIRMPGARTDTDLCMAPKLGWNNQLAEMIAQILAELFARRSGTRDWIGGCQRQQMRALEQVADMKRLLVHAADHLQAAGQRGSEIAFRYYERRLRRGTGGGGAVR
jgi:hypothetical protein